MNRNCECGGRFVPQSSDSNVARFTCDKCGHKTTQRKRTSQLGRIGIAPNDDKIRADMVREALKRTNDEHLIIASWNAPDAALTSLYRMLNP